jgi:hypothetical protein
MSKSTILASGTIHANDEIVVWLIEPDNLPAIVQISWPPRPTVIDPNLFADVASTIVKMFSTAHVELARFRARKYLS